MERDWRWRFLRLAGPGGYPGFLLGDWLRILADNRYGVAPIYLLRAFSNSFSSLINSTVAWNERRTFAEDIANADVQSPLFILGHWRSGTTYLHQLLALDERFSYPNLYQVSYPHTFLLTESASTRATRWLLPRARPFDRVQQTWGMPYEDEIAHAMTTLCSPYLCGLFPKNTEYYDRYLTFREASSKEVDAWKSGFVWFLKKLTVKTQRPLVLKSPPHTCRIRLLLELFPNAKFVHIHRNPFEVFQSTMHLIERGFPLIRFQPSNQVDWTARTLRVYREMYDAFLDERSLIPSGNFHELAYADLERDAVGQIRNIYEALALPDFAEVEGDLEHYLEATADYKKNSFSATSDELRKQIAREWRRCFEEWGYSQT